MMARVETLDKVMASESDRLKLTCASCGYRLVLTREQAFRVFGPGATPYLVTRGLHCRGCKHPIIHATV